MGVTRYRRVEPEILDGLAADDAHAQRSRSDLQRIHRVLGTLSVLERALDRATQPGAPRHLLELGAGDGSLMLRLALRRAERWPGLRVTLLDRRNVVPPATLDHLRHLGWNPRVLEQDVFDWLASPGHRHWDVVCAHLFLHRTEYRRR